MNRLIEACSVFRHAAVGAAALRRGRGGIGGIGADGKRKGADQQRQGAEAKEAGKDHVEVRSTARLLILRLLLLALGFG